MRAMTLTDADIARLPYRPCVGLMLLNGDGDVFAGQRIDNPGGAWQMPQGGIDEGESPREAALRELTEETGLPSDSVTVLRESTVWLPYELPRTLIPKLWGGRYRGQTQRWFALRYEGPDDAVRIDGDEPEFRCWAWMPYAELIDRIVPFKRDTYSMVFDEFADLVR